MCYDCTELPQSYALLQDNGHPRPHVRELSKLSFCCKLLNAPLLKQP